MVAPPFARLSGRRASPCALVMGNAEIDVRRAPIARRNRGSFPVVHSRKHPCRDAPSMIAFPSFQPSDGWISYPSIPIPIPPDGATTIVIPN